MTSDAEVCRIKINSVPSRALRRRESAPPRDNLEKTFTRRLERKIAVKSCRSGRSGWRTNRHARPRPQLLCRRWFCACAIASTSRCQTWPMNVTNRLISASFGRWMVSSFPLRRAARLPPPAATAGHARELSFSASRSRCAAGRSRSPARRALRGLPHRPSRRCAGCTARPRRSGCRAAGNRDHLVEAVARVAAAGRRFVSKSRSR